MQKTLAQIAQFVDGEVVGDADIVITGVSGIKEAKAGDLTFIANSKYLPLVNTTKASAIVAQKDIEIEGIATIRTDNPSLAFAKVASLVIDSQALSFKGIHPSAVIEDDISLGKNVNVGPSVVIEGGVKIGDNTSLGAGCFVGANTTIGENCLFYPNVTIAARIIIGSRVIVHSGTVIGSDGFGFVNVKGVHEKIPQIGTVEIEDDVEIGSNVCVDRARFDKTFIGQGTKIDNLVQIAHNVRIGKHCIIISQVGISGSCEIKDNATLAGQAGLAGHLTIGEGAIVASQAGVTNSVAPNQIVSGYPAKPHMHAKRVNACVQRLPQYIKTINDLAKRVEELEAKVKESK